MLTARALVALLLATLALAAFPGCSSSSCSDGDCTTGNRCVDDGKSNECRLVCDTQSVCPLNYFCTAAPDKTTYCAETTVKFAKADGQWGAGCNPAGGIENNPDCDAAQGFWCAARSPTDGEAYCTQFACGVDSDCGAGFYCGRLNDAPNARTPARSFGAERSGPACLKREYCAPCQADVDCLPVRGVAAHCAKGTDGSRFCTPECNRHAACQGDASCVDDPFVGTLICMPRAGTCKGDGSFCSPCRSDADCTEGICAVHDYSGEKYCTVKSKTGCSGTGRGCPAEAASGAAVACVSSSDYPAVPAGHCVGVVEFGTGSGTTTLPGCWTTNRK